MTYAFVYKMWHEDDPTQFYVGSTTRTLQRRKEHHLEDMLKYPARKLYAYLQGKDVSKIQMMELERIEFKTIPALRLRENYYICTLKPSLNCICAVLDVTKQKATRAKWKSDNKEHLIQYAKDDYEAKKEHKKALAKAYYDRNREAIVAKRRISRAKPCAKSTV
jgi:hypothetical protein